MTQNHLTQTVKYVEAMRETIGGSAQAVTERLQSQSQPLPSREDVTGSIWPGVILETDVGHMFMGAIMAQSGSSRTTMSPTPYHIALDRGNALTP
jgi:hypothetical protein